VGDLDQLRKEQRRSHEVIAESMPVETIELGDVEKVLSSDVSPRKIESFQLLLQQAEQQRRGRFTMTLLIIFGLTVGIGFTSIFAAMWLRLDTAPLRELMTGIVPAELALLGIAITFHYFDPKR
jgi:predicted anti-sigma-YlaC factor YlaD